jgi:hypothetical protein
MDRNENQPLPIDGVVFKPETGTWRATVEEYTGAEEANRRLRYVIKFELDPQLKGSPVRRLKLLVKSEEWLHWKARRYPNQVWNGVKKAVLTWLETDEGYDKCPIRLFDSNLYQLVPDPGDGETPAR